MAHAPCIRDKPSMANKMQERCHARVYAAAKPHTYQTDCSRIVLGTSYSNNGILQQKRNLRVVRVGSSHLSP